MSCNSSKEMLDVADYHSINLRNEARYRGGCWGPMCQLPRRMWIVLILVTIACWMQCSLQLLTLISSLTKTRSHQGGQHCDVASLYRLLQHCLCLLLPRILSHCNLSRIVCVFHVPYCCQRMPLLIAIQCLKEFPNLLDWIQCKMLGHNGRSGFWK